MKPLIINARGQVKLELVCDSPHDGLVLRGACTCKSKCAHNRILRPHTVRKYKKLSNKAARAVFARELHAILSEL